jgi:hypothetical protein
MDLGDVDENGEKETKSGVYETIEAETIVVEDEGSDEALAEIVGEG